MFNLECAIWEFTLKCNLRCSHCGSSAGDSRKNELNTKECFHLCEDLAELGCKEVAIMGGEPFLRKDWLPVAQCVKDLGIGCSFVSNGILIDLHIDKLSRLEPDVVGISLDGMKHCHELIRGKGTWEKTVRAIELLREHNIQTTIITTVSKINLRDLENIKDFILRKNINWQIQIATPFGNFKKEQMISEEEYFETALFIVKERMKYKFVDLPVVGSHCLGYYSEVIPDCEWYGCTAGISTIGITSDGGIVGCLSMGNNRFLEGNIRERSLVEIWEDPKSFKYNRKFEKSNLGPNCINCKFGEQCKGGCNSVSHILTNQFHNDPYCFYTIEKKFEKFKNLKFGSYKK
ncbi:MAG: radical SAM protein [Candidatus Helarchaeota archaeon]